MPSALTYGMNIQNSTNISWPFVISFLVRPRTFQHPLVYSGRDIIAYINGFKWVFCIFCHKMKFYLKNYIAHYTKKFMILEKLRRLVVDIYLCLPPDRTWYNVNNPKVDYLRWLVVDICLCLPPERTWYKVNNPKVDYLRRLVVEFISAFHQTGLDTRSITQRSIMLGDW